MAMLNNMGKKSRAPRVAKSIPQNEWDFRFVREDDKKDHLNFLIEYEYAREVDWLKNDVAFYQGSEKQSKVMGWWKLRKVVEEKLRNKLTEDEQKSANRILTVALNHRFNWMSYRSLYSQKDFPKPFIESSASRDQPAIQNAKSKNEVSSLVGGFSNDLRAFGVLPRISEFAIPPMGATIYPQFFVDFRKSNSVIKREFEDWLNNERNFKKLSKDPIPGRGGEPPLKLLKQLAAWRFSQRGFTFTEAQDHLIEILNTGVIDSNWKVVPRYTEQNKWDDSVEAAERYCESLFPTPPAVETVYNQVIEGFRPRCP